MKKLLKLIVSLVLAFSSCKLAIRKTLNLNKEIVFETKVDAETYFNSLDIKNSQYFFSKCNIKLYDGDSFFNKPSVVSRSHMFFYNSKGEYLDLVKYLKVCSNGYIDKTIAKRSVNFDSVEISLQYYNLDSVLKCLESEGKTEISRSNIEKVDIYILMYWNSIFENRYKSGIENVQSYLDGKYSYKFIVVSKDKIASQ